ncbi:MAG: ferrochelatase [Anaerolineales bacterium]|nr:ferrochelatase [Anaerolineales bacterium]
MPSRPTTSKNSSHPNRIGILLINAGTPQTPTTAALRAFLAEFLSDQRVIRWPRWLWWPLLHLFILRFRPRRVAQKYQGIWTDQGSPLLATSLTIARKLETVLQDLSNDPVSVTIGMRYGQPSIPAGLRELRDKAVDRLLLLPLFPQYSAVTTASAYDVVFNELGRWSKMPEIHAISGYHRKQGYIRALASSIDDFFSENGEPDHLLFSYHGIPKSHAQAGDPYGELCLETTKLVVQELNSANVRYETAFQSRFGPEEWLQPYTDVLLEEWSEDAAGSVYIICPGFSIDCLETLHEIDIEARQLYQKNGTNSFRYIPALNDHASHTQALVEIVQPFL